MKKQLPLLQEEHILPTEKFHISYSEVSAHMECSYRHKLLYIDKIILDGDSIHTLYGSALHNAAEKFLVTKKMPPVKEVIKDLQQMIANVEDDKKRFEIQEAAIDFIPQIEPTLEQLPKWLNETFPGWKVISAEHLLFEKIEKQTNIHFKGYIDAVLKVPKKRGKGFEYYILDWKTSGWGWKAEQKRDFKKQMQIILYKHYFCKFMNIDLKDAKAGFVLLKRVPKKDGNRIELIPISVGPKAVEKALKQVNSTINQIKRGFVTKNRMACKPFCPYLNTIHCK